MTPHVVNMIRVMMNERAVFILAPLLISSGRLGQTLWCGTKAFQLEAELQFDSSRCNQTLELERLAVK